MKKHIWMTTVEDLTPLQRKQLTTLWLNPRKSLTDIAREIYRPGDKLPSTDIIRDAGKILGLGERPKVSARKPGAHIVPNKWGYSK